MKDTPTPSTGNRGSAGRFVLAQTVPIVFCNVVSPWGQYSLLKVLLKISLNTNKRPFFLSALVYVGDPPPKKRTHFGPPTHIMSPALHTIYRTEIISTLRFIMGEEKNDIM